MKVSQNLLNNNLNKVKISKLGNVKLGDVLNAKIVEVSDSKVIAEIKGKLVILNDLLSLNLAEGESIKLEVAKKENGKVYARPMNLEFKEELDYKVAAQRLKLLDVEVTDKNIKVLNFLNKNNIRFSQGELKELVDNIKYIEKMISHIEKGNVDLSKLDISNDLRQELVKIIKLESQNPELINNKEELNFELNKNISEELKALIKIEDFELKEPAKSEFTESSQLNKFDVSLLKELGNVEVENVMFLVKEKFDINISNLLLSKNFFIDEKNISESLEKIINIIENSADTELSDKIKVFFEKVFVNSNIKDLDLDEITKEIFGKDFFNAEGREVEELSELKEEILFIKKATDFNDDLNDKINYFQFSLNKDSELREVEILVKKNKNKKKNDGLKIYLSLDTKNIDTIKSIIELKNNKLDISFIGKEEKYKKILENNIDILREVLDSMNFRKVSFTFKSSGKRNIKKDFLLKDIVSKIDMRV